MKGFVGVVDADVCQDTTVIVAGRSIVVPGPLDEVIAPSCPPCCIFDVMRVLLVFVLNHRRVVRFQFGGSHLLLGQTCAQVSQLLLGFLDAALVESNA